MIPKSNLLGEEVVELCSDTLAHRVLVLVIDGLMQVRKFVVFHYLLHLHGLISVD